MTDKTKTDKERILDDEEWVNCYICEQIYLRKRETLRYCNTCERGFCEGEHGTFSGRGPAHCIVCTPSLKL